MTVRTGYMLRVIAALVVVSVVALFAAMRVTAENPPDDETGKIERTPHLILVSLWNPMGFMDGDRAKRLRIATTTGMIAISDDVIYAPGYICVTTHRRAETPTSYSYDATCQKTDAGQGYEWLTDADGRSIGVEKVTMEVIHSAENYGVAEIVWQGESLGMFVSARGLP